MKAIKTTAGILLTLGIIGGFIYWSEKRTEAQEQAYSAYDNCVQATYGMSVASYYQEHGEMPECK